MAIDTEAHSIDRGVPVLETNTSPYSDSKTILHKEQAKSAGEDQVLEHIARMVLAEYVPSANTNTTLSDLSQLHILSADDLISDVNSPAFLALAKANEKIDATLFNKRPRIGQNKLGRTKYSTRHVNGSSAPQQTKQIGDVIDDKHEQYALTYGMMCGILNSAGRHHVISEQPLLPRDFDRVDKREFPGNAKLKHAFKFKDYSPDVFCHIRTRFAIDNADYMVTLCGDFNYIQFLANSKSNQFFFYSYDGRFMIKTLSKDESRFLRQILPQYYQYVMENPDTLLSRFYGMHRVKMHHLRRKMHFIIMANVFDTPLEIHTKFDLKGSLIGRQATQEELKTHQVMKDLDFLESESRVALNLDERSRVLEQMKRDVGFLQRMKIMDYSLLIGVHREKPGREDVYERLKKLREKTSVEMKNVGFKGFSASFSSLPSTPMVKNFQLDTLASPRSNLNMFSRMLRSISSPKPQSKFTAFSTRADRANTTPNTPIEELTAQKRQSLSQNSEMYRMERHSFSSSSESDIEKCWPASTGEEILSSLGNSRETLAVRHESGIAGHDEDGNPCFYFLGIIDILQQYNRRKVAETLIKGIRHDRKHISAVNSAFYGDRFLEFMDKHVLNRKMDKLSQSDITPEP